MKPGKHRSLLWICFICYSIALFSILFFRTDYGRIDFSDYPYWHRIRDKINLVPFVSIAEQLRSIFGDGRYTRPVALRNLAANMVLFAPMGLLLPMLFQRLRQLQVCIAVWCGLILSIEVLQLLTLQGSFDIDDVILNTIGFVIGYGIYALVQWLLAYIRKEK